MALSRTQIFNMALSKLGRERVESADEDTRPARVLRDRFEDALTVNLAAHSFDFAMRQAKLARLTTTPVARYIYEYQKPGDWLRSVVLSEYEDMQPPLLDFVDMGGKILTDAEDVFMEYVAFTDDTTKFTAQFTNLLATYLALETIKDITGTDAQKNQLISQYQEALRTARAFDSIQGAPKRPQPGGWVTAKRSRISRSEFY